MALANESTDHHIQACNHIYGVFPSSSSDLHLQSEFGFFDHLPFHDQAEIDVIGEGSSAGKDTISSSFKNFSMVYNNNSSSPTTSSQSSENSGGYGFQGLEYVTNDVRPSLNIKLTYENCMHPNGSLLSFEKAKGPIPQNGFNNFGLLENFNPQPTDSNFFVSMNKKIVREKQGDDLLAGWITCDSTSNDVEEIAADGISNHIHKRPQMGENNTKSQKKQCTTATKKSKVNPLPSKDPQSVAAKNRRERISERLKILQELVPNGSKVDLVTMLEKAISYVKFLQLQVKVLASDEFWPDQGGKAPELSQVKEAIDTILSSHQINKCSR